MRKSGRNLALVMGSVFVLLTVVWIVSFFFICRLFGRPDSPGGVGDLFGAVGALFSGWAFAGILWAILLQRRSLQVQHDDLKASLEEMKQARQAHEESAGTLRAQVEAMRLQTRAQILTVLVETPLQADSNKFLREYSKKMPELRTRFEEYLKQLIDIERELQE